MRGHVRGCYAVATRSGAFRQEKHRQETEPGDCAPTVKVPKSPAR
jgi:hypothetical protein